MSNLNNRENLINLANNNTTVQIIQRMKVQGQGSISTNDNVWFNVANCNFRAGAVDEIVEDEKGCKIYMK